MTARVFTEQDMRQVALLAAGAATAPVTSLYRRDTEQLAREGREAAAFALSEFYAIYLDDEERAA